MGPVDGTHDSGLRSYIGQKGTHERASAKRWDPLHDRRALGQAPPADEQGNGVETGARPRR